jgi:hypothetical protein
MPTFGGRIAVTYIGMCGSPVGGRGGRVLAQSTCPLRSSVRNLPSYIGSGTTGVWEEERGDFVNMRAISLYLALSVSLSLHLSL